MAVYTLPDLPYDVGALAPHLSAELLGLHHGKHHAAYVKGANETLEKLATAEAAQITGLDRALAFNVSGHVLHSMFWTSMSPDGGGRPDGELAAAIDDSFGSYDTFAAQFGAALTTVQGSGWAALVWEPLAQRLLVTQLHDHQSNTLVGSTPVLLADAWEHAYYLDYRNDKQAWSAAFFALADWRSAAERFAGRAITASSAR
jgi:Fe-Mn family superoxide dismutase